MKNLILFKFWTFFICIITHCNCIVTNCTWNVSYFNCFFLYFDCKKGQNNCFSM